MANRFVFVAFFGHHRLEFAVLINPALELIAGNAWEYHVALSFSGSRRAIGAKRLKFILIAALPQIRGIILLSTLSRWSEGTIRLPLEGAVQLAIDNVSMGG